MKQMSKLFTLHYLLVITSLVFIIQSCGLVGQNNSDGGEALGVAGRQGWQTTTPSNMITVPGGSYIMGQVDEDITDSKVSFNRQVTVSSFYMDDAEITNNKYRQFIVEIKKTASKATASEENMPAETDSEAASSKAKWPTIDENFIMAHLYPDSTVWRANFAHHMGDPMVEYYFSHPAFDDYPVVGVTWEGAKYFAEWRTAYLNADREKRGLWPMPSFRLPTETEWVYAARGGRESTKFPWGGPYIKNYQGEVLANFKHSRGNYTVYGSAYTSPVKQFTPNDYGLYDMAGNVAEWCLDAYNASAIPKIFDLNPVYHDEKEPRKVIKGGSWKDISHYLQTGIKSYAHQDSATSYIGFRCVMPYFKSATN